MESFDKLSTAAAPAPNRLSTFDWVKEKATELRADARNYLADKSNRQLAVEGVTLATGLAASALLHVNLSKSGKLIAGKLLEGLIVDQTDTVAVGGQFRALAGVTKGVSHGTPFEKLLLPARNESLTFEQAPFRVDTSNRFKPASLSSKESLFEDGFTLPKGVNFRSATRKPPNIIITDDLPRIDNPAYDRIVAKRFNLRLDLADENSIGIMHPRFRNGAKQLTMMKSLDRNLSLYGNKESGVGVLEYEHLPSVRPYFKHADSVVQIKFTGKSSGVGTGTLISDRGLIATAAHVVPPGRDIMVDTINGQFKAKIVARSYDEETDMAAIQLIGVPKGLKFPVPTITSAGLTERMRAATIGHPQGLSGKFASVGMYLKDLDFDTALKGEHPTFLLDSVMPGNSGGPIFDADGNFAVILTKLFTPEKGSEYAKLNRAMVTGERVEDLLALLKQEGQK
ncbi:MAG: serine protease [Candidatus Obscuribacterales bacterium]|nr:serine protease [Candidatus Obscuribacterales bacterium]